MSIRDIAVKYLKSLQPEERTALKNMVEKGVICCNDYAKKHGITAQMITNELKTIFKE